MGFRDKAIDDTNSKYEWTEELFDEEKMLPANPNA
jgi:hypothetical protein